MNIENAQQQFERINNAILRSDAPLYEKGKYYVHYAKPLLLSLIYGDIESLLLTIHKPDEEQSEWVIPDRYKGTSETSTWQDRIDSLEEP